ncbi:MAG: hypothetical protein CVV41_06720 [Candidatus Riflebacteria bacterium HGW-Riflebacteria-1]|jgi:hypothetical protein|nr:MAG: hypothetical protein CVV42_21480 [Candidatus Riflebacteria bacterium HGW-Riflebacteria-2]PKL44325.1 MAG: hypothetical protein CVV41_06720 [Candidatus Riflebacteria bacterium HGW-Riflebacteria-1]
MKNKLFQSLPLVVALVVCLAIVALAGEARYFIPGGSQRTTNSDYVIPVITEPSTGYLTPATATFSIPANTAVKVPTLPDGTKKFRVYVVPGAGANFGPAGVASGTNWPDIASDTISDYFHVGTTTPNVYYIGRAGAATGTLLCE